MSKNYEVLREVGKDLELFKTETPAPAAVREPASVSFNGSKRVREEILRLIQRTFLSGGPDAPRRVIFTSVDRGNGCSWVCARTAEALAAQVEGTVCVVEADHRTPSLHRYFGVGRGSGLADAMLQQGPVHDFARQIRGTNLWLMSGRESLSDASDSLSADQLKSRFAELCSEFRYVLVDAPPVGESADSLIYGRLSDGAVLVLEAHSTRRESARKAKECLEAANIRVLGAVLNKRTYPLPEALYKRI